MKLVYLAIALLIFSNTLKAEDVGYEVEVIIFEDSTGTYAHSELWQDNTKGTGNIESTVDINNDSSNNKTSTQASTNTRTDKEIFTYIANDKLRLINQAKKLSASNDYKVLYHRAWKQTGLDRDQAFPVHIDSRNPQSTESLKEPEQETNNVTGNYIDGSITLIMSRYLHINTDLVYHKPVTQESLSFTDNTTSLSDTHNNFQDLPVKFERRMRSREIHYIDHPMVGIIVLATPYKILEPTTPNSPNTQYKSL